MISKQRAIRLANRDVQRAYRERHATDILKARRISTALMRLRSVHAELTPREEAYRTKALLGGVVNLLSDFLTEEEFKVLIKVLWDSLPRTAVKK